MGIEAHFGLWQHDPGGNGMAAGEEYPYINREDFRKGDPDLAAIIDGYLSPYWAYTAKIASEFDGTFSLVYDKEATYTNKSQYLKDVTLTGDNNSSVIGNDLDNRLTGNSGDNTFRPNRGADNIDGSAGEDTVVFTGSRAQYRISKRGNSVTVTDTVVDRDGYNTLTDIEKIRFFDRVVEVTEL